MQLVLFLVVVGLASTLVTVILRHRRRGRARPQTGAPPRAPAQEANAGATQPALAQICPACGLRYPTGLRFCPADARPLIPLGGDVVAGRAAGTQCPRCGRLYDPGKRFCPFDAEELVTPGPLPLPPSARRPPVPPARMAAGKICPYCSARYDADAIQCGRDGADLVSVN